MDLKLVSFHGFLGCGRGSDVEGVLQMQPIRHKFSGKSEILSKNESDFWRGGGSSNYLEEREILREKIGRASCRERV